LISFRISSKNIPFIRKTNEELAADDGEVTVSAAKSADSKTPIHIASFYKSVRDQMKTDMEEIYKTS
jgi:hypothetical protein